VTSSFNAFAARKTAKALNAKLEPWKTDADDPRHDQTAIGSAWTRSLFDGDFYVSRQPSTSLVFVESREGNTAARDPSALGGGETDTHLIYEGLSRVAADAVMAGAETVRSGSIVFSVWHPELVALRASLGLPRHPVQIVATLRGIAMDGTLLFNEPDLRVVLLTAATFSAAMHHEIAQRPWITPVVMRDAHDLRGGFDSLRQLGINTISCVGGRTLANQLIDAGLVDDLYLTQSPRSGGEPDTPLRAGGIEGEVVVRKHGTGADEGVRFVQLTFARS
jgi:riboflavin biosynthesis pyrimidine reductase